MQTVKTTIVVVLLLTVTYSAYVALTTQPVDVPEELVDLIQEDGTGFSLDEQIDIGVPGAIDGDLMADAATPPSFGFDAELPAPLDSGDASGIPNSLSAGAFDGAIAGVPANSAPSMNGGVAQATLSDEGDLTNSPGGSTSMMPAGDKAKTNRSLPRPERLASNDFETLDLNQLADSGSTGAASAGYGVPGVDSTDTEVTTGGTSTDSAGMSAAAQAARTALVNAMATADRQREKDQLKAALTTLSLFHNAPDLTEEDRNALLARMDWLAGEVIYSTRHLLEQPYRVSQGETLRDVANALEVPWQLLGTVNGVTDPDAIVPGQDLKVIRGPFRAEVSLTRNELTLFLGELYAGRFPISVGGDPSPVPGIYTVQDKQRDRTYYSLGGGNIPAGDPRNPYGDVWLDLGSQMCIHGAPTTPSDKGAGCIQLRPADAQDVFGILSRGSSVSIIR